MSDSFHESWCVALDAPQQAIWRQLAPHVEDFTLYGGTACAVQLGHRLSVDFDFFSSNPVPTTKLLALPCLKGCTITQQQNNTLSVEANGVKISFFGGLHFGRVGKPLVIKDIQCASLLDILGLKLAVIQQRAEWKDYTDIAALFRSGMNIQDGMAAAQALYKDQFNPDFTMRALSYFNDLDKPLRIDDINLIRQQRLSFAPDKHRPLPVLSQSLTLHNHSLDRGFSI